MKQIICSIILALTPAGILAASNAAAHIPILCQPVAAAVAGLVASIILFALFHFLGKHILN